MNKIILFFVVSSIMFTIPQAAQQINKTLPQIKQQYNYSGAIRSVTINEPEGNYYSPVINQQGNMLNASMIRWSFTDPIAIGDQCATSSNGLYQAVGWGLNTKRVSLYNNNSNTPVWEFPTHVNGFINYVAVSDTGGYIVNGSYHNIYIFNNSTNTPFFNFNLETQLPDTGSAGPVAITADGGFIIATASRSDSSWIFGFNRNSTNWIWRYRVGQTNAGGAGIQGVKISGNDSLVILNTYMGFYVFRTYTGQLVYSGSINPIANNGTQYPQAISGNGNYIATINYNGILRVYQWNGSTYNFLWQNAEGSAWMSTVDISNDGTMIACGTLNFLGGSNYDGKIKFFNTGSSTPVWTYSGCGDMVTNVSFSKNGRILAASTWGDMNNANNDLLIFKTSVLAAAPIFGVNSPGSFFWCNTSANGSTVVTSGKRVHARTFGNGGEVYNIFIDTNDVPLSTGNNTNIPADFKLHQNYPNPFNPVTQINYDLVKDEFVNITIFDVLGREVNTLVNKDQKGGKYSVILNAEDMTSGIYFYRISAGDFTDTKKLILIK